MRFISLILLVFFASIAYSAGTGNSFLLDLNLSEADLNSWGETVIVDEINVGGGGGGGTSYRSYNPRVDFFSPQPTGLEWGLIETIEFPFRSFLTMIRYGSWRIAEVEMHREKFFEKLENEFHDSCWIGYKKAVRP